MAEAPAVNQLEILRNTAWDTNAPALVGNNVAPAAAVDAVNIPLVSDATSYSILNGDPESIVPYILQAAVPVTYRWVPVRGVSPATAMKCMDGFIRSHIFYVTANGTPELAAKANWYRWLGIILGAARAVITANYDITQAAINPQELATPVLNANFAANGTVTYNVLVADNVQNIALLTGDLNLQLNEIEVIKVVVRCAQAIIPLQGLNLINEGHHYLSDRTRPSFKAFLAVERQTWTSDQFKTLLGLFQEDVRDALWHKAGHPVDIRIKEEAAMSPVVKENLNRAKLGSATARLPAVETDVRAAATYLKIAESVNALWAVMGGRINADALRVRVESLEVLPKNAPDLAQPIVYGPGESAVNRDQALDAVRTAINKSSEMIATAFGFYCAMMDASAGEISDMGIDTLRAAHSLDRLKKNSLAPFLRGIALHKAYRAQEAREREAGTVLMPEYTLLG